MADNKSARPVSKGFVRATAPPADIETHDEPQSALAQRLTLLDPSDIGSGRPSRYEWEIYVSELLDRVEVIEQAGGITPGGGGSGVSFVHNQAAPAGTWSITHNLGTKPAATIVVGGAEMYTEVQYPSDNQTVVVFSTPTAGTAYLRG